MSKSIEEMSVYEQARWFALFEAVNVIYQKGNKLNLRTRDVDLKPIPIKKYIDSMTPQFIKMLEQQEQEKIEKSKVPLLFPVSTPMEGVAHE